MIGKNYCWTVFVIKIQVNIVHYFHSDENWKKTKKGFVKDVTTFNLKISQPNIKVNCVNVELFYVFGLNAQFKAKIYNIEFFAQKYKCWSKMLLKV